MADPKNLFALYTTAAGAGDLHHDSHSEAIASLPEQDVKTLAEDEEVLLKMQAKLFRYATEKSPPEWKERGTGVVKLLKHKQKGMIRLLMRRNRTLKVCANHCFIPMMELKPNAGNNRAWVWFTPADFADGCPKPEILAICFFNAHNAQKFKLMFDKCKEEVRKDLEGKGNTDGRDKVTEELEELSVKDEAKEEKKGEEKW
uniref:ran-specific GTPase-activating protein-like n=1 Tax=Solea senegalensis TaxID=28829 RepID=UPI001CD8D9D4|nr:ran-specific GTPase-activating protein-like [Solea senegalensis]